MLSLVNTAYLPYTPRAIMTNISWLQTTLSCSMCVLLSGTHPSWADVESTVDDFFLVPTGNFQGGYKFFALATIQKIEDQYQFTHMSMPYFVIKWVEKSLTVKGNLKTLFFVRETTRWLRRTLLRIIHHTIPFDLFLSLVVLWCYFCPKHIHGLSNSSWCVGVVGCSVV